jgi:hypothetical protein
MCQKDFEKIGEISKSLKKILRDHAAADSILVSKAWRWAGGEIVFSKTDLVEITDDAIILRVEEDRWFQELSGMKSELIARLNDFLETKRFKKIVLKKGEKI